MQIKYLNILIIGLSTLFSSHVLSSDLNYKYVSIYNNYYGIILYAHKAYRSAYVGANYAARINKFSTWRIVRIGGYYRFANTSRSLCLTWYGNGYGAIQEKCSQNNSNQLFSFISKENETYVVKLKGGKNQCLVAKSKTYYWPYTDTCPRGTVPGPYRWSFIPPKTPSRIK